MKKESHLLGRNTQPDEPIYASLVLIILLLTACAGKIPTTTTSPTYFLQPTSTPAIPLELQTYLDTALDLIRENSLYSTAADWAELRAWAYESASGSQSTSDLYPVIEMVLGAIGDRHGYLMPPVDADAYFEVPVEPIPAIQQALLQDRLGQIVVPAFVSGNAEAVLQFATQIQAAIQSLDAQGVCGWIVDVRYNDGGNGFAMLAGLAPLLGDGVYGYHTYANGDLFEWRYKDGKMYMGEIQQVELPDPYQLIQPGKPIAVLTSELTTSAGEIVAIAFRDWPNTRSFGQETWGRTTAPHGYFLSDGAILGVSVAYFTDHTGHVYNEKVAPDEYILEDKAPEFRNRSVPQPAIDWLLNQPACAGQ